MNARLPRYLFMLATFALVALALPTALLANEAPEGADRVIIEEMVIADELAQRDTGQTDVEVQVDDDRTVPDETAEQTTVIENDRSDAPHWAAVIGRNALWGGLAGGLVGLGIWLLTDLDWSPWTIAQFAGGGILVGAAVGGVELLVRADDYAAQMPASLVWMERDMPETINVRLLNISF